MRAARGAPGGQAASRSPPQPLARARAAVPCRGAPERSRRTPSRAAARPRGARCRYLPRQELRSRGRAPHRLSFWNPSRAKRLEKTVPRKMRSIFRGHPDRCGFESLAAFLGGQRLGELVELAFEDPVEVVHGQLYAVVGDAVLRIVVGTNLLRALARPDLRAPRRRLLGRLLLALQLVEPRPED